MSVLDNVMLAPVKLKGLKPSIVRAKSLELLDMVDMSHKAKAYPNQLTCSVRQPHFKHVV